MANMRVWDTVLKHFTQLSGKDGSAYVRLEPALSGERNRESVLGSDYLSVAGEWQIKNLAYNAADLVIYNGPCLIAGIEVTTAMSAHASAIDDDTTTVYPIPASRAVGIYTFPGPVVFKTKAVWDPGSLSAGAALFFYKPLDPAVIWS